MLDRIRIFGFRRFLSADSWVGRKTVALVGPNEAGKSSVLGALKLFSSDDPVPPDEITRSLRGETLNLDRAVVELWVTLDETQKTIAKSLPIDHEKLRPAVRQRRRDGGDDRGGLPAPASSC